jgi:hypothetical protein
LLLKSGSPQNVYLLPQRQNFSLERSPRPKQICHHANNEPDKISPPATASPDSRSTASQIEFATDDGSLIRGDAVEITVHRTCRAMRRGFQDAQRFSYGGLPRAQQTKKQ